MAVTTTRESDNKVTEKTRYFISSLRANDPRLGQVVRARWAIENNLHWVLDIAFDEYNNRTRTGFSVDNLAVI
ncbi:MAG: ISAs1 family transposase [Methylococcaceae bacterium]|nr:ISAs1 family transposase [Methylococcaceae bacterium]